MLIDAFVKVLPHRQRLQPGAVLDQIKGATVQMPRFSQIFIGVQFTGKIGQYPPEGECVGKPVFFVPVLRNQMAIDVPYKGQIVQIILLIPV